MGFFGAFRQQACEKDSVWNRGLKKENKTIDNEAEKGGETENVVQY